MTRSRGALFALSLAVAVLLNFAHPLSSDEGTTLAGAWNMIGGKRLYLDFFEFDAPGAYVLTFASFVVFGAYYWSARAAALVLLAASGVAVGFVAERLGARRGAAIGAALAWVTLASLPGLLVNHNPLSAFVAAIALALAVATLDAPDAPWRWALVGLALGLVPVFHQAKGVALAASVVPTLVVLRARTRLGSAVLLLAAAAMPIAVACATWGPVVLFERCVLWPMHHYVSVNRVSPITFILALLVAIALGGVAWASGAKRATLALVLAAQGALLASALTRPDLDHVLFVAFPLPALAAIGFDGLPRPARRRWALVAGGIFAAVAWACIARNATMDASRRAIVGALRAARVTRFYAEPFAPQLYFELGAENPYPYSALFTGMYTDDQFAANLAVLARERPPFVLRSRGIVEKFRYDWSNPLDRWIDAHYAATSSVGNLEILAWRGDGVAP